MNTKTFLMLPLLLLLVLITPTVAHATNESSYKLGYKTSYDGYKCYADDPQGPGCAARYFRCSLGDIPSAVAALVNSGFMAA
jgi:hypothetical protein